jgi:hypothetical protein
VHRGHALDFRGGARRTGSITLWLLAAVLFMVPLAVR